MSVHYREGGFPPDDRLNWEKLIPFIGPATGALARYDGMLAAIPNPDILLAPLTTHEAVLSSRIEGTQATMGEVLEFEVGQEPASPELRADIHEILNYRRAMRRAEEMLGELPLDERVIHEAHRILLGGVRGQDKSPGEFRRGPNWIGPPGCSLEDARFVPIEAERLPDAMGAWERYMRGETSDRLVQLAVLHAEFEALHPFRDGNGRLGRMLVPLFLWQNRLIHKPMFYISAYFEKHRDDYYDGLLAVSRDDDWTGWCRFFLEAVRTQAESDLEKARKIFDLYGVMRGRFLKIAPTNLAIPALDWIFERPIFTAPLFAKHLGASQLTARRILQALRESRTIKVIAKARGRTAATLAFAELLNITEGEDVF